MIIEEPDLSYGKDAYWFSHDSNARNDNKCVKLRRVLGMEGYGIFWALVEMLRESKNYRLPLSYITDIAFDLRVSEEKITAVIKNFELFDFDENEFFSLRLIRSMDKLEEKRNKLSNAGRKGGLSTAQARLKQGSSIIVKDSIVDNSKGNESKKEESRENETTLVKDFEWYLKQFDEIYVENLKMVHKDKDFMQAAKESYAHLAADDLRIKNAESSDCKKLLNTWLSNQKNNGKQTTNTPESRAAKLAEYFAAKSNQ